MQYQLMPIKIQVYPVSVAASFRTLKHFYIKLAILFQVIDGYSQVKGR
jgi:hypothetical protein